MRLGHQQCPTDHQQRDTERGHPKTSAPIIRPGSDPPTEIGASFPAADPNA
jgi:hypothetical protein